MVDFRELKKQATKCNIQLSAKMGWYGMVWYGMGWYGMGRDGTGHTPHQTRAPANNGIMETLTLFQRKRQGQRFATGEQQLCYSQTKTVFPKIAR